MESRSQKSRLRLLSLDGGGVRGLSSIMILKDIMRGINRGRLSKDHLHPWQVFDMIGGTSTGGLIAIMLGRLRMSINECEAAYLTLSKRIFNPKRAGVNVIGRAKDLWKADGRFDAEELRLAIQETIEGRELDTETLLKEEDSPCKVFVCAVLTSNTRACVLRSYENEEEAELLYDSCKIWEACRATSAATTFFDPITIGPYGQSFADGAIKYNNPIQLLYREAETIWPSQFHEAVFVSIGTGSAPSPALEGGLVGIAQALKDIVVQTESTADDFFKDHSAITEQGLLFRFQVYHGLAEVGLEEYKESRRIADATHAYINSGEIRNLWRRCVSRLLENSNQVELRVPIARGHAPTRRKLPPPTLPERPKLPQTPPQSTSSLDCTSDQAPSIRDSHSELSLTLSPPKSVTSPVFTSYIPIEERQTGFAIPCDLPTYATSTQIDDYFVVQNSGPTNTQGSQEIKESSNSQQVITDTIDDEQTIYPQDPNEAFLKAIDTGDLINVQRLMQCGGIDLDSDSGRPLFLAIRLGHVEIVKYLLQNGASVNVCNEEKDTPLHKVALSGNVILAKVLVDHGADVNAKRQDDNTALHSAVTADHASPAIVRLLLDRGVHVNAQSKECQETALYHAAGRGYDDIALLLLRKGADPGIKDQRGCTALHVAALLGKTSIVRMLLQFNENQHRATLINAPEESGWTALHFAVARTHEETVRVLLDYGAGPNTKISSAERFGKLGRMTALHIAVKAKNVAIVRLLIERGADAMSKDSFGHTPLDDAKDPAIIKLLPPQSRTAMGRRILSMYGFIGEETFKAAKIGVKKMTDTF